MADDQLRMRLTVLSAPALAEARKQGREIGQIPGKAGQATKQVNREMEALSRTTKRLGMDLRTAFPALGTLGIGASNWRQSFMASPPVSCGRDP